MQRFFTSPEFIQQDQIIVTDPEVIHQMSRVLRMSVGDTAIFLDNTGAEYRATLTEIAKKHLTFKIDEKSDVPKNTGVAITLYQALPKKADTLELIFQKATELGVTRLVPMVSEFCNRRELGKADRLMRIVIEAAEQSERRTIPEVTEVVSFEKAVAEYATKQNGDAGALFHSRGASKKLNAYLHTLTKPQAFSLFIGPEGGFSEREVVMAEKAGVPILSLGSQILRTETAAIVAVGCVGQFFE